MPTLKKRSGKTTITLYASEERQIVGSIDTYKFAETNGDERLKAAGKELAERAVAFLKMLEPPAKEKQGELIPDDKKGAAK